MFWELDPVRRARVGRRGRRRDEKEAWVSQVLREWGSCGRVGARRRRRRRATLIYAPPAYVPGRRGFPTAPVAPDAVLLTTAYVVPEHAGGGLGRMLMQGMAKDLIERGGDPGGGGVRRHPAAVDGAAARCMLPADFLGSVGFKTQRAAPAPRRGCGWSCARR